MATTAVYNDTNNKPLSITEKEYREILSVPEVREAWGIDESGINDSPYLYTVKFDYLSGSPGYVGPLYLVYGDCLTGTPFVLIREDGRLVVANDELQP